MKNFTITNGAVSRDVYEDLENRRFVLNEFIKYYNGTTEMHKKDLGFAEKYQELSHVKFMLEHLVIQF